MTRLSDARKKAKLTQRQVADLLGISVCWVGFIENNRGVPSIPLFCKMCDLYHMDESDTHDALYDIYELHKEQV